MRPAHEDDGAQIMAAVDASEFVIADLDRDEAWLSVDERDAAILTDWR